ncbi:MAG: DUF2336 domain-containing protein [Alphaproteobacteria bacterium]|nr:DUF2336 domain-containing protein [Alphaproteobacteria bacterium]
MVDQSASTIPDLCALAKSGSIGDRTKLVGLICDLRFCAGRELSADEELLANDILMQLVNDKSCTVRAELAERLSREPDAPKELVLCLALDVIEVARPILKRSQCLWDAELIQIARSRTEEHRLTIAGRRSIPPSVADALVGMGERSVLNALLQNQGASLPKGSVEFFNEQAKLLQLARDRSAAGRKNLVSCVSDLAFSIKRKLTSKESALIGQVLCQLISEVEREVRAALAQKFADQPNAPEDLISLLANDHIDVAQPILLRSKLLKDPELIEIVQLRTMQHRLAVAARKEVSEQVSDALVDAGEPEVVTKLLKNNGARISEGTLDRLVDESERIQSYQKPLLLRKDLKAELATRMYRWVSAALRKHIVSNFDIDPSALDQTLEEALSSLLTKIQIAERDKKDINIRKLLQDPNARKPEFLIALLRSGQVIFFEKLFSELTKLPHEATQKFIYGAGGEAFAIAAKALGMAETHFKTLFMLSRRARTGQKLVNSQHAKRAVSVFRRTPADGAKRVVERWRIDPTYLPFLKHFPLEQFENL